MIEPNPTIAGPYPPPSAFLFPRFRQTHHADQILTEKEITLSANAINSQKRVCRVKMQARRTLTPSDQSIKRAFA